jgi:uncharacterized alkaline shock family protein YloU
MDGHAVISQDVLARYAADAAREVDGIAGLVPSQMHRHRGVRVFDDRVELHVRVAWGVSIPDVGRALRERVGEYLGSMANAEFAVDVVVDEVAGPVNIPRGASQVTGAPR